MNNSYTEQLEMQLRFAEEEAQERERNAYYQGKADAIDTYEKRLIEHIETCKELYKSAKRAGDNQGMMIHDSKIAALEWELEKLKEQKE